MISVRRRRRRRQNRIMVLLLLLAASATMTITAEPAIKLPTNRSLSFGYWCSDAAFGCSFRAFSLIAGELLLVDSGSSNFAFCEIPNPTRAYNVRRLINNTDNGEPNYLSQCTTFSGGNHGWYGPSYVGDFTIETVVEGSGTTEEFQQYPAVFSVMEKIAGLNGNSCGPVKEGSVGLELSKIRGIWGLGGIPGLGYNNFIAGGEIDESTWPELGDRKEEGGLAACPEGGCQCPDFIATFPSNFNTALARSGTDRYAIHWNGLYGRDTGTLAIGDDKINKLVARTLPPSSSSPLDGHPKIRLLESPQGAPMINVSKFEVNGVEVLIPPDDNNNATTTTTTTASTTYYSFIIDTGAPSIRLPGEVYDAINFDTKDTATIELFATKVVPSLGEVGDDAAVAGSSNLYDPIVLTATQQLMDDGVFLPDRTGSGAPLLLGLHLMRYAEIVAYDFGPNPYPYVQIIPRIPPITTPTKNITVTSNGLAGSTSNVTIDLDPYKTPPATSSSSSATLFPSLLQLLLRHIVGSAVIAASFCVSFL